MDVILASLLVTAINVGAADRTLADLTGKCGYYTNTREQQVLHPCGIWRNGGVVSR
jgi:hypothetical protein